MIPYPLFMFRIAWADKSLDLRACQILENGFTFRVASEWEKELLNPGKYIVCFQDKETKKYIEYEVTGEVERIPAETENTDCRNTFNEKKRDVIEVTYSFCSWDARFLRDFHSMLSDYMHMIRTKTENDDLEAMELLTGISLSQNYMKDVTEWKNKFCPNEQKGKKAVDSIKLQPVEIGISLDCRDFLEKYLEMDFTDFRKYYFIENHLSDFPITQNKVTHLYVGNAFCPYVFQNPKEDERLIKVLEKSIKEGLEPVLVFSPIPQSMMNKTEKFLEKVKAFLEKQERKIEVVVNDYGTPILLQGLENNFEITAGILLNKRKKDPRIQTVDSFRTEQLFPGGNMYEEDCILAALKNRLNISAVSYEGTGKEYFSGDFSFGKLPAILHIPRFQVNTSNCMLHSICEFGDRGKRGDLSKCPHYCEKKAIFFSDNLPIIGLGNSIFGVSSEEINDIPFLNSLIQKGVKRIVLRL